MDYTGALRLQHQGTPQFGPAISPSYIFEPRVMCALFRAISHCSTPQMKLLLYLLGNRGDGSFQLNDEAICVACNLTQRQQHRALGELLLLGWICREQNSLIVQVDKILESVSVAVVK